MRARHPWKITMAVCIARLTISVSLVIEPP